MEKSEQSSATRKTMLELALDSRLLSIILVSSIATWGTFAVSPILPEIASTFDVSDSEIGLVMSAYTFPVIIFAPLSGMLGDRIGRRIVVLSSLGLFGVAGVAMAFATSFESILLFRVLQGVAFGGMMPIALTLIGDIYSGPEGATAQGFRFGANAITGVAVPPLAGLLVTIGWNYPFFLYLVCFPVMVILYKTLPATYSAPNSNGKFLSGSRTYWQQILAEVRKPDKIVLVMGGFVTSYVFFEIFTFIPIYAIRELGATPGEAALILSTIGFQIVISPLSGPLVRYFGRKPVILVTIAIVSIAHLLIPLSESIITLGIIIGLVLATQAIFGPVLENYLVSSITEEYRSGIVSGYQGMKNVGKTIAPVFLGGVLALFGFEWVFRSTALVLGVYALTIQYAIKKR